MKTISTGHGAIKQTPCNGIWRFEFLDTPQLNGDYKCDSEAEAKNRYFSIVAHANQDTPAHKACALLLEWVEQGKRGLPEAQTLDDAVTFAQIALKR